MKRPARLAPVCCGVVALLFGLAACSGKRTPTAPVNPGTPAGNDLTRALLSRMPAAFIVPTTIDSTASLLLTTSIDGREIAAAAFLSGNTFIHAGDVEVWAGATTPVVLDTIIFPFRGAPSTLYTTLESNPDGWALAFDGTAEHVFTVAGHPGSFPAFLDSVRSVAAPIVNQPAAHGFYPRSTDLLVSWTNPGADTTVYVTAAIVMNAPEDTTVRISTATTRDVSGQLTIGSDRLQLLPPGYATLVVSRYRLVYRTISGGPRVGIVCEAVTTILLHVS